MGGKEESGGRKQSSRREEGEEESGRGRVEREADIRPSGSVARYQAKL